MGVRAYVCIKVDGLHFQTEQEVLERVRICASRWITKTTVKLSRSFNRVKLITWTVKLSRSFSHATRQLEKDWWGANGAAISRQLAEVLERVLY